MDREGTSESRDRHLLIQAMSIVETNLVTQQDSQLDNWMILTEQLGEAQTREHDYARAIQEAEWRNTFVTDIVLGADLAGIKKDYYDAIIHTRTLRTWRQKVEALYFENSVLLSSVRWISWMARHE